MASRLENHAIAYVLLKEAVLREKLAPRPFRLRRRHLRRFWEDYKAGRYADLDVPESLPALRERFGPDRLKEGLVHALLDHLHEQWRAWPSRNGGQISLKEEFTFVLRTIALTYGFQPVDASTGWWRAGEERDQELERKLANHLIQQFRHAPLELATALGLPPNHGLPLLHQGQGLPEERRFREVMREAAGGAPFRFEDRPGKTYTCRPLAKKDALDRGNLGGDCSSGAVPFRALSPHHVYYGIFDGEEQQRGYMTVFEAWAETRDGRKIPILCLETINVPNLRYFDAVQEDLLAIFDSIARSRGLHPRIVLIMGSGTWNYQNWDILRQSRRFRQGKPVHLSPADPIHWQIYRLVVEDEATSYSAFGGSGINENYRILASFDGQVDAIQPENLAEARRLAALPRRQPVVTARKEDEVVGFISELPQAL